MPPLGCCQALRDLAATLLKVNIPCISSEDAPGQAVWSKDFMAAKQTQLLSLHAPPSPAGHWPWSQWRPQGAWLQPSRQGGKMEVGGMDSGDPEESPLLFPTHPPPPFPVTATCETGDLPSLCFSTVPHSVQGPVSGAGFLPDSQLVSLKCCRSLLPTLKRCH